LRQRDPVCALLPFLAAPCQEEHHGRAPNSSLQRRHSFSGVRQQHDVHLAHTNANSHPGASARRNGGSIPVGARSTSGAAGFTPNPIMVAVGTAVTWTNNDSIAHDVTSDTGVWNSSSMAPGTQFTFKFQTAGTFPYHCAVHPGMVGTVTVQ
jgi:plastocyanin